MRNDLTKNTAISGEISVTNVAGYMSTEVDEDINWELIHELSDKLGSIGANTKEIVKINQWLKGELEKTIKSKKRELDGVIKSQIIRVLMDLIDVRDNLKNCDEEDIFICTAPYVEEGFFEIKRGSSTQNKMEMSFEIVSQIQAYKCHNADAALVDTTINDKILRFCNLFRDFCNSKGLVCDIKPIRNHGNVDVTVYGRIASEGESPLDEMNAIIQGNTIYDFGAKARLTNIQSLEEVSLFSGQMVALTGRFFEDQFGIRCVVSKLRCGIPVERPFTTIHSQKKFQQENLHISVIRGFLLTESLESTNFHYVFNKIKRDKPHIVIFMGPFVGANQVTVEGSESANCGDLVFIYSKFIREVCAVAEIPQLQSTKFIIVPHCYDVMSSYPLPQPPLNCHASPISKIKHPDNVIFLSNPGFLRVNGILFGVTSCDPLSSIAKNAIFMPKDNMINRICQQLLYQRSFFPNYPVSLLPAEYAIDHSMLRHLEFSDTSVPDIFLFSSAIKQEPFLEFCDFRAFISCHSASQAPKHSVVQSTTDIYISAPFNDKNETIQSLELEKRVSLSVNILRL